MNRNWILSMILFIALPLSAQQNEKSQGIPGKLADTQEQLDALAAEMRREIKKLHQKLQAVQEGVGRQIAELESLVIPEQPCVMFSQQDRVLRFNTLSGEGIQVGTAKSQRGCGPGQITGDSIVNFRFNIVELPNLEFDNRVGITDLDGDQIIFENKGTGRFVIPPLIDPGASLLNQVFGGTPVPCPGFGGPCAGVGGPLEGTYRVVATSGKYVELYPIDTEFLYRGVAYNPSSPPADNFDLGTVYVEVYWPPLTD